MVVAGFHVFLMELMKHMAKEEEIDIWVTEYLTFHPVSVPFKIF
jgi:iron-sulfur cluster repair protein YtfE (RIC family)